MSICYDMWIPETSRTLAVLGAEVILHPTLTRSIDRDVELSIARATATTNQCYVFDINGIGDGGNGRSIICDPEGTVLYEAGSGEETIPLEIDLEHVRRSRSRGLLRLGQPLKSFRDRPVDFPIYQPGARYPYLDSLGPLEKPTRAGKKDDASTAASPSAGLQRTTAEPSDAKGDSTT
jgi:deaminated glutathione amidase